MFNSSEVSEMSNQEFNNKMFEIFNNPDFDVVRRKIWKMYNGDLDGCKQWLAYCKHSNFDYPNEDEKIWLDMWNGLSESKAERTIFNYCDDDESWSVLHKFTYVERKNNILVRLNYIMITQRDEMVKEVYYEEKQMS